ncbi:MAG: FAD-binding oxidoreductase [Chthoniobacterales bacterium]
MTNTSEIDTSTINDFRARLRGELLSPGDHGYDTARRVWNGVIDKHPALIVRCAEVSDVICAVRFALDEQLRVAVRSGGHSVAGHGVCDGGLVIDLSRMKRIRVEPDRCTARTEAGVTTGEFLSATQKFGLATPTCPRSDVGLSGLALGGGIGWLSGKYGMTCDNLLAVDIVTAEGKLLTASAAEHPDLFWAVRGGGGNFGVVVALEFRLHPAAQILAGMLIHPIERAREALHFYHEYTRTCCDDLTVDAAIVTSPDGRPMVGFVACYCGAYSEGEKVLAPLRAFGLPITDLIRPMTIVEAHSLSDHFSPAGRNYYFRAYGLRDLAEPAVDQLSQYGAARTSAFSAVVLRHFHGAATRVPPEATAVPLRDEQYILEIITQWTEDDAKPHMDWAHRFEAAMKPFARESVSVNLLGDEGEARVRASYGANHSRLARLKQKYDPTNFFYLNQNIKPHKTGILGVSNDRFSI